MEPAQIMRLAERLRWLFPRHPEVLQAAAELERLVRAPPVVVERIVEAPVARRGTPKRDRALYMRNYRKGRKA